MRRSSPVSAALVALSFLLVAAAGCKGKSRGGADPVGALVPAFDVEVTADRYTGTPGTTFIYRAASFTATGTIAFAWELADGTSAAGDTVSLTLDDPGLFVSTVTATDDRGQSVTAEVLSTVFPAAGMASTGLLGAPRAALPGDADGDGHILLEDALLCARLVGRAEPAVDAAQVQRCDATLDGRVENDDLAYVAGALDGGGAVPSALSEQAGGVGKLVRMRAPELLDPAANFRVRIGDGPSVLLDRFELGLGAFVVLPGVPVGPTEVFLEDDNGVVRGFAFDVTAPYASGQEPGALFQRLMEIEQQALPLARRGLADYMASVANDPQDQDLVVALWDAAQQQLATTAEQVSGLLATLPADTVQLLEQIAVENGLLDRIAQGEALLGGAAPGTAPLLLTDVDLAALCWLSNYKSTPAAIGGSWAGIACEVVGDAALIVGIIIAAIGAPTGWVAAAALTALGALVSVCTTAAAPIAVSETITEFAPDMGRAELRLEATPDVLSAQSGFQSQLRVSLTVPLDPTLCAGAGSLREKILKKAAEKVLRRAPLVNKAVKIADRLPKRLRETFLDQIEEAIASSLGTALDESQIGQRLDEVTDVICTLGTALGATVAPDGVLTGPDPNVGTLQLAPAGTEQPSIYTGDPNQQETVTFVAEKDICGTVRRAEAQVSYGTAMVTITMGDNGSLLDDIFLVEVDGQPVLTSQVPVTSISTTEELTLGEHTVVMRGLAAPDGIGTYFIQFSGATVLPGSDRLTGTDLVPGTFKTFFIEVE